MKKQNIVQTQQTNINITKEEGKNPKKIHPYAKASFILSLFFWLPAINVFTGILAIVFGIVALREIKNDQKGKGFAIAGITISATVIILSILGFILYPELYLGQSTTIPNN